MKKIIYSTIIIAICAFVYYSCDNSERIVKDVDNYGTRYKIPVKSCENNTIKNTDSINGAIICPNCKSDSIADIEYGLMCKRGIEIEDSIRKAKGERPFIPGGCVVGPENYHCFSCKYRW